ncbi:hypothetical protein RRG08_044736 [Elysia crispata]|uniref:Uncharacterized protein n=1 Tax=Elysia crispata TaxID=231223 RepID=A0AAE0ZIT2_9GAST|nr:hypothetical protein RRG08_044736 [Elysia crispata]
MNLFSPLRLQHRAPLPFPIQFPSFPIITGHDVWTEGPHRQNLISEFCKPVIQAEKSGRQSLAYSDISSHGLSVCLSICRFNCSSQYMSQTPFSMRILLFTS